MKISLNCTCSVALIERKALVDLAFISPSKLT